MIVQKLLLPLIPSLHAGGGLLFNDAVYFNTAASYIAEQIRLHGWSYWQPLQLQGNVAILSAVYAILGEDPAWIIPINAALHALGGLLIFLLARELSEDKHIAICAGMIAASLFVIFPSALNWYSQLHKDGYAIAGILLILLTLLKAVRRPTAIRDWIALAMGCITGLLMVASVRPYLLEILVVAMLGACLATIVVALARRRLRGGAALLVLLLLVGTTILFGGLEFFKEARPTTALSPESGYSRDNWQSSNWQWQNTTWLPGCIEHYIEAAARNRAVVINHGFQVKAQSMIDPDIAPQNISEVVSFLPRALQVAIFAPFPSSWLKNRSLFHMVASGEMFIFYLCFPGILLLLWYNRNPAVLLSLYFSCFFLLALGFTNANLGTLYRMRYGYFFILLLQGVLGWITWLDRTGRFQRLFNLVSPSIRWSQSDALAETDQLPLRKKRSTRDLWSWF